MPRMPRHAPRKWLLLGNSARVRLPRSGKRQTRSLANKWQHKRHKDETEDSPSLVLVKALAASHSVIWTDDAERIQVERDLREAIEVICICHNLAIVRLGVLQDIRKDHE